MRDQFEVSFQEGVRNPLLLESHFFAKPILNEIVEDHLLVGVEARKDGAARRLKIILDHT